MYLGLMFNSQAWAAKDFTELVMKSRLNQKQVPEVFYKSSDLQFYPKETSTQVFSCEYCEIFKNIYFEEHL